MDGNPGKVDRLRKLGELQYLDEMAEKPLSSSEP